MMPGRPWSKPDVVMRAATVMQITAGVLIALVLYGGMQSAPAPAVVPPATEPEPPPSVPPPTTTTTTPPALPPTTTLPPSTTVPTTVGETMPEARGAEPQPEAEPPAVPPPPTVTPVTPVTPPPPTTVRLPRNRATGLVHADDLDICLVERNKNLLQMPCRI